MKKFGESWQPSITLGKHRMPRDSEEIPFYVIPRKRGNATRDLVDKGQTVAELFLMMASVGSAAVNS